MQSIFPHDRPVDRWPTDPASSKTGKMVHGDVPGRVQVGVEAKATTGATKFALALAAAAITLAATAALLAGVTRIDGHDVDADQFGLVVDKALESREAPGVQSAPLFPAGLHAGPDVGQIFHRDGRSPLNRRDDLFGQNVVAVAAKTVYPAGQLFEMSLGRLGAFRLEGALDPEVPILDFAPMPLSEKLVVACNRRAPNPEVNPHHLSGWFRFRDILLDNNVYPEPTSPIRTEVGGTNIPIDPVGVMRWDLKGYVLATIEGRQGGCACGEPHGGGSGVVSDRTVSGARDRYLPALFLQGADRLQRLGCFHPCRADELGRKVGILPFLPVGGVVEFDSVDPPLLVAGGADPVERAGVGLDGFLEDPHLFIVGPNPELHGDLHIHILTRLETAVKNRIPLPAEPGSLLRRI